MTTPPEPGPEDRPNYPPPPPMPSAPPLDERVLGAAPAKPQSVETSFKLWLAIAAISLITSILSITLGAQEFKDTARQSLEQQRDGTVTQQEVDDLANITMIIGLVIALAFIGLFLLFAFKMRAGRNWARITLAVLGGLSIVVTLIGLGATDPVTLIIRLGQVVLVLSALYFMFRPDANQYFAANKRLR